MFKNNELKSHNRILTNLTILGICFTAFTFLIGIKPEILESNKFLSLQLTLAIPFFITSILARTKQTDNKTYKIWNNLGFATYIIAYSFFVNVLGILLSTFVSIFVSMLFFITNILLALVYSYIEVKYNKYEIRSRLIKDGYFILILIFFGMLPALGFY